MIIMSPIPEPLRTHLGWLLAKVTKDPNYPEARGIWEQYVDYVDSLVDDNEDTSWGV